MKPQVSIEQVEAAETSYFVIHKEEQEQRETIEQQFSSYQHALDFVLEQGWQLKRDNPDSALHVESRFLKP